MIAGDTTTYLNPSAPANTMPKRKILLRREHKQYVPDLDREVTISKEVSYHVPDAGKDFHTSFGVITKKELAKKPGNTAKTSQGKEFTILDADFIDDLKRLKRIPQAMSLKELGLIIVTTGINKDSTIIDAGAGSGFAACALAHLCKKVTSYEIIDQHLALAKQNAAFLGLKNVTFRKGSIYDKIPEKNADLVLLDVPEPERAINTAANALKVGGYLAIYTLQATQLQNAANAVLKDKRLLMLKSCELLERLWKADGKVIRPHNIPIGHTGFLTFARKTC
jgi:tRNA (adenine57-N1/adenine58-N1)-methyltransferase